VNDTDILGIFTRILRDLLDDDAIDLRMDTLRSDVPGWDSFMYVNFIVAAEMELKLKFGVADVEAFKTVGDIVAGARALLA
jgi:acyl carrier protein